MKILNCNRDTPTINSFYCISFDASLLLAMKLVYYFSQLYMEQRVGKACMPGKTLQFAPFARSMPAEALCQATRCMKQIIKYFCLSFHPFSNAKNICTPPINCKAFITPTVLKVLFN